MERKLATVLFVDLVGSTALVSGSDPEVARRRVQQYFDKVSHCVVTHGGIVEKFAGDAVMAAYGIPQAHEDDAERAIRAALGILHSVKELGLDVYLVEVLPWNNAHPAADRPITELNRLIARIGAEEGVPVIAWHDAVEDPATPGLMSRELTADGDHPSVEGYRVLGELVARALRGG